jgi:hypothetical protein
VLGSLSKCGADFSRIPPPALSSYSDSSSRLPPSHLSLFQEYAAMFS